eukprot:gb/GECG01012128.1/.p1 GENE.gb/GECG01012128.1/~~gb/GECG01012128.1/.p1  ORF type:complete len:502 (+),score=75.69 gb/GECG01012128.1/:1-1506(+)
MMMIRTASGLYRRILPVLALSSSRGRQEALVCGRTHYARFLCYPYTTRTQKRPIKKQGKQQKTQWAPDQPVYGTVEEVHKDHWRVHLEGFGDAKLPETQWIRNPPGKGAREVFFIQSMEEDNVPNVALHPHGKKSVDDCEAQVKLWFSRHGNLLPLTQEASTLEIYQKLGMSKKQFKSVISRLLKDKKIFMFSDTISYVGNSTSGDNSGGLNKKQRSLVAKNHEFKKQREKNVKASVEQHYGLLDENWKSNRRRTSKPVPLMVTDSGPSVRSSVDHAKRLGRGSSFVAFGEVAPTHTDLPFIKDDRGTQQLVKASRKHEYQEEHGDDIYSDSEASPEEWELSSTPMDAEDWRRKEEDVARKYGYQVLTMPGAIEEKPINESTESVTRSGQQHTESKSKYRRKSKRDDTKRSANKPLTKKDDELYGNANFELEVDDNVADLAFFERELGDMFGGYDEIQSDDEEYIRSMNKARESPRFLSQKKLRQIRRAVHRRQVKEINRY